MADKSVATGAHPIALVAITARQISVSSAFYASVFGWQVTRMSDALMAATAPAGPWIALRSDVAEGFQASVAFISVPDVASALSGVVAAGARIERAPWSAPMAGTMARFSDASGTVYGVLDATMPAPPASIPPPFGDNPRPPAGSICSLEMYAADGAATAEFFGTHFGWSARSTMPHYMMFEPGAGIGGVWQSHTPGTRGIAYIYSTDVRDTIAAIEAAGGTSMSAPMSVPGMATFGYFTDPSGTPMGLIGP